METPLQKPVQEKTQMETPLQKPEQEETQMETHLQKPEQEETQMEIRARNLKWKETKMKDVPFWVNVCALCVATKKLTPYLFHAVTSIRVWIVLGNVLRAQEVVVRYAKYMQHQTN